MEPGQLPGRGPHNPPAASLTRLQPCLRPFGGRPRYRAGGAYADHCETTSGDQRRGLRVRIQGREGRPVPVGIERERVAPLLQAGSACRAARVSDSAVNHCAINQGNEQGRFDMTHDLLDNGLAPSPVNMRVWVGRQRRRRLRQSVSLFGAVRDAAGLDD